MTKTKAQLRAEAVERLNGMDEWCDGVKSGADFMKALLWDLRVIDEEHVRDALIDLLTDDCGPCYSCAKLAELVAENSQLRVKVDELANGIDGETNGIEAGSPLVDELPERDALTLMRRGFGEMLDALGIDRNEKGHCTNAIHTLADMVERDYVSREAYDDLRDEFVWINTFLHRVGKQCGTKDVPSLKAYVEQLEAKVAEHESEERRMAPHDCGHIADMSEMSADCVHSEPEMSAISENLGLSQDSEIDSREKLEADVRKLLYDVWTDGWELGSRDAMGGKDRMCDALALLDRQAAIMERELCKQCEWPSLAAQPDQEAYDRIAELQAEVDELTEQLESAHAKNRSLKAHIGKMQEGRHGWHVKYPELEKKNAELQAKADRLARENMSLAHDLGECMAERDGLRRENAKLSDDEFYLRCTLVDMDGEVVG